MAILAGGPGSEGVVNVLDALRVAGFQVISSGRFWVITEASGSLPTDEASPSGPAGLNLINELRVLAQLDASRGAAL